MGINRLNSLLNRYTTKRRVHLSQLKGKTIAIDLSIFFYKFIRSKNNTDNNYIDYFEKQINQLLRYDVTPIYIFDGKPGPEKQNLLAERRQTRDKCKQKIKDNANHVQNKILEKKIITFKKRDKFRLIELFNKRTIEYICAEGEADEQCVKMYRERTIHGVFTEDNDILLGKVKIYKNLCEFKDVVYEYCIFDILRQLQISYDNFISICILAGTSYSPKWCDIFDAFDLCKFGKLPNIPDALKEMYIRKI